MKKNENRTEVNERFSERLLAMISLVRTAMLYRYRGSGWRRPALLCASVFDVLLYCAALSLVMESVFQLQGPGRLMIMLTGLIALRWTLSCTLQAYRVAHFSEISRPFYRCPDLATTIIALGPSSLVFLISVVLLCFAIVWTGHEPSTILHMLGWGFFVALVHLSWNSFFVLVVIKARSLGFLKSEVPIILCFVLVLILSPVAYQFGDIPDSTSRILTSFNPASHLLAGYQNAFWHMSAPSLEVLPGSALIAGLLIFVFWFLLRNPPLKMEEPNDDTSSTLVFWSGRGWSLSNVQKTSAHEQNHRIWPNELPCISGEEFLCLIGATRSRLEDSRAIFLKLSGTQDGEQLLETPLQNMTWANRCRLGVAAILPSLVCEFVTAENVRKPQGSSGSLIIFDGLLDHSNAQEIQALTDIVFFGNAKNFAIRTYHGGIEKLLLSATPNKNILITGS
jgi:hypothetical protein